MKSDINTTEDIDCLIDLFYKNLSKIESMKPYFTHVDWHKHLPIMRGFWYFTLLNIPNSYVGNVMNPHIHLHKQIPFTNEAFSTWLSVFNASVDALYSGARAQEAKNIAKNIALTMKYKLLGSDYTNHTFDIKIE